MTYCSFEDVAEMAGFQPSDMDYLGSEMDYTQYKDFVIKKIAEATGLINRYCNVSSFEEREIVDEVHTMNQFDRMPFRYGISAPLLFNTYNYYDDYSNLTRIFFPRQQPVISVDSLKINQSLPTVEPAWIDLVQSTETTNGDYQVVTVFDQTQVYLIKRYPVYGIKNIRVTYTAGYPEDHRVWSDIRIATVMVVINMLNYKKKMQEVATVRGSAVADMAPLFDFAGGPFISKDVMNILDRWRRPPLTPEAYM